MNIPRGLFSLLFVFVLFSCDEDEYIDLFDDNDEAVEFSEGYGIKISKYMNQESSGGSVQGAAAYGDYLFQFQDHNEAVFIYNLAKKCYIKKVVLTPNTDNHCNQASFSNIFYNEKDNFPLLYVSGARSGTYNHIQVYKITGEDESIELEQIQEIILPETTSQNYVSWTCAILDNENNSLYAYANNSHVRLIKFDIPDYHQEIVNLKDTDIIGFIPLDFIDHQQGGIIRNDILYMIFGVPGWGDQVWLRIFNIKTKTEIVRYNLSEKKFKGEPEGLFFYNNELFVATNNVGIYKIKFTKY